MPRFGSSRSAPTHTQQPLKLALSRSLFERPRTSNEGIHDGSFAADSNGEASMDMDSDGDEGPAPPYFGIPSQSPRVSNAGEESMDLTVNVGRALGRFDESGNPLPPQADPLSDVWLTLAQTTQNGRVDDAEESSSETDDEGINIDNFEQSCAMDMTSVIPPTFEHALEINTHQPTAQIHDDLEPEDGPSADLLSTGNLASPKVSTLLPTLDACCLLNMPAFDAPASHSFHLRFSAYDRGLLHG